VFKNRALVTGIGVGIIVGAILLQVMLIRPSSPSKSGISLEEMDPQKLKEEASKYYLVLEKNVKMYTQTELDSAVQKKLKEETDKLAASKPQDQSKASPPTVSSKIVIYVQQNLDASTVADLLFRSGVISDRKAFITELDKQGGNTKIQVGYHEFEGIMDMASIVTNLITAQ
jgi:gas vesicle protein